MKLESQRKKRRSAYGELTTDVLEEGYSSEEAAEGDIGAIKGKFKKRSEAARRDSLPEEDSGDD
jgi:hypothetical protein